MPTIKQYLNQNYPNKEITEINLSGWNDKDNKWEAILNWEKLTGELDLSEFPNLEKLDCSYNQITSLNLSNCPNLTELKCWENELTEIKFSSSQLKLKIFYAWTNNLTKIDWKKTFDSKSLIKISISNNNLDKQNVSVFSEFTNLEELYLGNDIEKRLEEDILNRFTGSLKSLQNLNKLKKLQIEGTEIDDSELVKYLPQPDLQVISWGKQEIIKIVKQLDLSKKEEKEESDKLLLAKNKVEFEKVLNEIVINYAEVRLGSDLTSRQREQITEISSSLATIVQPEKNKITNFKKLKEKLKELEKVLSEVKDKMIANIVPRERLYVIRSNIKKFVNKWGVKESDNNDDSGQKEGAKQYVGWAVLPITWSYDKIGQLWKKEENKRILSELSKLQTPKQYEKNWYWTVPQWAGRGAVGISGVLGISGNLTFGSHQVGAIAVASPVVETVTSYAKSNWYDTKEKQWIEFTQDAKELLDNYHELLGILRIIRTGGIGQLNYVLEKLKRAVEEFLNEYDDDKNGVINVFELSNDENKDKLANDLNKEGKQIGGSKLGRIVKLMEMLEEKINDYGQGNLFGETSLLASKKNELAWIIIDSLAEHSDFGLDVEEKYNKRGKNSWSVKDNWIEYLKDINITKEEDFKKQKTNLLYPLIEVITETKKLEKIANQLKNSASNKRLLTDFKRKVHIICQLKQELENEKLNDTLSSLENKAKDFLTYLEKKPSDGVRNETSVTMEEEKHNMDEIVKAIKNIEEKLQSCYDAFVSKDKDEKTIENNYSKERGQDKVVNTALEMKDDEIIKDFEIKEEKYEDEQKQTKDSQLIAQIEIK